MCSRFEEKLEELIRCRLKEKYKALYGGSTGTYSDVDDMDVSLEMNKLAEKLVGLLEDDD